MSHWYQILVRRADEPRLSLLFPDLVQREVRNLFVKPYESGDDIFTKGRVHRPEDFAEIKIIRTADRSEVTRARIVQGEQKLAEDLNQRADTGIVIPGRGYYEEDLAHEGDDVTFHFITSGPGQEPYWRAFAKNPWVITLVCGFILAVFVETCF